MKSLGQIAYEAYCETTGWKSAVSGAPLPPYEQQNPAIITAWESAGHAARNYAPALRDGTTPSKKDLVWNNPPDQYVEYGGAQLRLEALRARELHLIDVYAALGIPWGSDIFAAIAELKKTGAFAESEPIAEAAQ